MSPQRLGWGGNGHVPKISKTEKYFSIFTKKAKKILARRLLGRVVATNQKILVTPLGFTRLARPVETLYIFSVSACSLPLFQSLCRSTIYGGLIRCHSIYKLEWKHASVHCGADGHARPCKGYVTEIKQNCNILTTSTSTVILYRITSQIRRRQRLENRQLVHWRIQTPKLGATLSSFPFPTLSFPSPPPSP